MKTVSSLIHDLQKYPANAHVQVSVLFGGGEAMAYFPWACWPARVALDYAEPTAPGKRVTGAEGMVTLSVNLRGAAGVPVAFTSRENYRALEKRRKALRKQNT